MNSPSSSRLLQVTNFDKCRWTLLKLNSSKISVSKFKKRREISSSLAYFLYKTWYQAFWRRSRAVTEKKCTKSVMQVQNCCFGYWTYCFFNVLVAVAVVCLPRWGIFYGALLLACDVTNIGRDLGRHLGFYQELEIRWKPREMVIFCALHEK